MQESAPQERPNYFAMTVNERLFKAGLLDEWDRALRNENRARMIELLRLVDLEDAEAIVATVFANPNRYGHRSAHRLRGNRGRRSPAREAELVTRDFIARCVGFGVGVGTAAVLVFHQPRRVLRGPALADVSPTAAWLVIALATVGYFFLVRRVETDFLWKYWATLFVGVLAAVNVLRLLLLAL